MEIPTGVLPAIREMKHFEVALKSTNDSIIFLETRLAQLKSLVTYAKRANKKVFLHLDLVQGLKADEYGMEFLMREIKPDGILSTRRNVISLAKKYRLIAIQRMFLLDTVAVDHNLKLIEKTQPDCIEILPALVPGIIETIKEKTGLPVIAGGLVKTQEDINAALDAGAIAVSTSKAKLWK